MITEDYVSFEIAKLLKEKGFPQEYDDYHALVYNEEDYEDEYEVQRMVLQTRLIKAGTLSSYPVGVPEPKCYCPTLQMAMRWFREEHKIAINIRITCKETISYAFDIWDFEIIHPNEFVGGTIDLIEQQFDFKSYEEACEAAIKYCLENLI